MEEAAGRLADILKEENADVLTIYDDYGTYGHPDHIQVHRVGMRAAEIAGTARVYQQTVNRTLATSGPVVPEIAKDPKFGKPESMLTTAVDVTAFTEHKRCAMRADVSHRRSALLPVLT